MLPSEVAKNKRPKFKILVEVQAVVKMYLYFRFVGGACHACYTTQDQCHQSCVATGDTRDTSEQKFVARVHATVKACQKKRVFKAGLKLKDARSLDNSIGPDLAKSSLFKKT